MKLNTRISAAVGLAALISTSLIGGAIAPLAQAAAPNPGPEVAVGLSAGGSAQGNPAVAWNGSVYLVVWEEYAALRSDIYGARVSATGALLGGGPFLISSSFEDNLHLNPAVASNGNNFMVVYGLENSGEYGDLFAAIVGGNGAITRSEWGFKRIDNQQSDAAIAWNGSRYLVTWEDTPDWTPSIFGARAFADGRSYDGCTFEKCPESEIDNPGIPIRYTGETDPPNTFDQPAVTASNGTFHIAWDDTENATDTDIRGARLRNGVVLDATPYIVSNAIRVQRDPAITANGAKVLTAWTDRRSGTTQDVYADLGGTDFAVSTGAGAQSSPTLAKRGSGFLAAWTDSRAGNQDVYAGGITATGARQDGNGLPIAASNASESEASVAAGGNGKQLIVYTKGTGNTARINFRLIS